MMMNDNYIYKSLSAVHVFIVSCISNQGRTLQNFFTHQSWPSWSLTYFFPKCFRGPISVEMVRQAMATIDSPILVPCNQPSLSFALEPCSLPLGSCSSHGLLELYLPSHMLWDR